MLQRKYSGLKNYTKMKMKKSLYAILFLSLVGICFVACTPDENENIKQVESPVWTAVTTNYPANMTAVISLPSNLQAYMGENDKLAAFNGDSCRGIAQIVDNQFFLVIKGDPQENYKVTIKYYNARLKYLYEVKDFTTFDADMVIGTSDNPEILPFTVIK